MVLDNGYLRCQFIHQFTSFDDAYFNIFVKRISFFFLFQTGNQDVLQQFVSARPDIQLPFKSHFAIEIL